MFQRALPCSELPHGRARRPRGDRTSVGLRRFTALFVLWSLSVPLAVAWAQAPVEDPDTPPPVPVAPEAPPPLTLPTDPAVGSSGVQQVVIPLSDEVRRRIEAALRRPAADDQGRPLPPATTGDPILDDVLEVIRRRGSLLDGSSLDPQAESLADELPAPPPALPPLRRQPWSPSDRMSEGLGRDDADELPGVVNRDARFDAAEALLRAARKLATLPGGDEGAQRLIAAMRERATMLLLDEFSPTAAQLE